MSNPQIQRTLSEVATIPAGAQLWSPSSLASTSQYFIYSSTYSLYVYQRNPVIFFKTIQLNNAPICCIAANDTSIAVASLDQKIRFFDAKSLDATREVLLSRNDAPIAISYHPHLQDTVLLLYNEDDNQGYIGELRSINVVTGNSITIISDLKEVTDMVCSPYRAEVSILGENGSVDMFGIDQDGSIVYQRSILASKLRYFNESSPLCNLVYQEESQNSDFIIQVINEFLKHHKKRGSYRGCSGLSYDPFCQDYFVVSWACGIHAQFHAVTGQALQLYEVQNNGIQAVSYSQTISGKFYTTEFASGVYKEWNVSQSAPISDRKLTQNSLCRLHVAKTGTLHIYDQLHFIDGKGRIIIVNAQKYSIVFQSQMNHSESIMDLKVDEKSGNFITAGYDGFGRQWNFNSFYNQNPQDIADSLEVFHVEYSEKDGGIKFTSDQTESSSQFLNKLKIPSLAAVSCLFIQNLSVIGFKNGLIVAFDKKTGRPLSNLFSPNQYVSNFNDAMTEMVSEFVTINQKYLAQKNAQVDRKLFCMEYNNSFLFTGWRDGGIRIIRTSLMQSKTLGCYLEASFLTEINFLNIVKAPNNMDMKIKQIKVHDSQLYCCTHSGLFFVVDLTEFYQIASTVEATPQNKSSLSKQLAQTLTKMVFVGNLSNGCQQDQIINSSKNANLSSAARYHNFYNLEINDLSDIEQSYFKAKDQSSPRKMLHLVDNYGVVCGLYQIGLSSKDMAFKVAYIYQEELNNDNMNSNQSVYDNHTAIQFVKYLAPFKIAFGGAEGLLKILDYSLKLPIIGELRSTKCDLSCCQVSKGMLIVGCYDGSIKVIDLKGLLKTETDVVNRFIACYKENRGLSDDEFTMLKNQLCPNIYLTDIIHDLLHKQRQINQLHGPLSTDNLYQRSFLILFSLSYQFCTATGQKPDILTKLKDEANRIVGQKTDSISQLQEYIESVVLQGNYTLYNMQLVDNSDFGKQKIQIMFQNILLLCQALNKNEFLADLLFSTGLHDFTLLAAQNVNKQFWLSYATKLTKSRLVTKENISSTPATRFDLRKFIPHHFFSNLINYSSLIQKQIKSEEDETVIFNEYDKLIQTFVKNQQLFLAKLLVTNYQGDQQRKHELSMKVTEHISNYYFTIGLPMYSVCEYLSVEMHKEALKAIVLTGENLLFQYVLTELEAAGFDQFQGLRVINLAELMSQAGIQMSAITFKNTNLPADPNEIYLSKVLKIQDYLNMQFVRFGGEISDSLSLDKIGSFCNYIRKTAIFEWSSGGKQLPPDICDANVEQLSAYPTRPAIQTYAKLTDAIAALKLTSDGLCENSAELQFLLKHLAFCRVDVHPQKNKTIHKLFLIAAQNTARINFVKPFRHLVSQAARLQRKLGLEADDLVTEAASANLTDLYTRWAGTPTFAAQFNGRSIFESADARAYSMFLPFDKSHFWNDDFFL